MTGLDFQMERHGEERRRTNMGALDPGFDDASVVPFVRVVT